MGRNKHDGTDFETRLVNEAIAKGLKAQRAPNAAPGWDIDLIADVPMALEAKRRANLNVHATLADTLRRYSQQARCGVVWHKLARKEGNQRRTAVGPTVMVMAWRDALKLLVIAQRAAELVKTLPDGEAVQLRAALLDAAPTT